MAMSWTALARLSLQTVSSRLRVQPRAPPLAQLTVLRTSLMANKIYCYDDRILLPTEQSTMAADLSVSVPSVS
jgi:hypothetical protein